MPCWWLSALAYAAEGRMSESHGNAGEKKMMGWYFSGVRCPNMDIINCSSCVLLQIKMSLLPSG